MQNIFITGANRGLGLEFVRRFLERGDRIFAACRNPKEAGYLQALRQSAPVGNLTIIKLDVANDLSILDAFAVVNTKIKGLDLLINNAGIYLGRRGAANNLSADVSGDDLGLLNYDEGVDVMRTNAIGPMILTQQFLPLLKAGNNPRVVSITSGYGSITNNNWGEPFHYSASKAALNMYMRSFAVRAKPLGITSVVISPGWVQTEMGGMDAPLKPLQSVDGMLRVIDALSLKQTGTFFDWQGDILDW